MEALSSTSDHEGCIIKITVRGCGQFGAYSSIKPRNCTIDKKIEEFTYSAEDGLLLLKLDGGCQTKEIEFTY